MAGRDYDEDDDEIIREVRRARRNEFEEAGGTLDGLFEMLKKQEKDEARRVVNLPPRKATRSAAKPD